MLPERRYPEFFMWVKLAFGRVESCPLDADEVQRLKRDAENM